MMTKWVEIIMNCCDDNLIHPKVYSITEEELK
jgi:hypothetical protein